MYMHGWFEIFSMSSSQQIIERSNWCLSEQEIRFQMTSIKIGLAKIRIRAGFVATWTRITTRIFPCKPGQARHLSGPGFQSGLSNPHVPI